MSFKEFYQNELTALRQNAAQLCERRPSLSPLIGQGIRDPDVERLMQGASFLTARLRQKIEDEFPQITHGLIQRLWSHHLRSMPSMSIVQFDPAPTRQVPRHCEVVSRAIDGVQCRFRTTFDVQVMPLELNHLEHADAGKGAVLTLGLRQSARGHLGELNLQKLRLHFAGKPSIAHQLYLSLIRHLRKVRLTPLNEFAEYLYDEARKPIQFTLDASCIKPVGFDADQALLDHPPSHQSGYRLLQEFFVFREKFLFVDITGLDVIQGLDHELLKQACGLELRFELGQFPKELERPTLDNIRLYCSPVVNLFEHQACPITLQAGQRNYPLLPTEMPAHACEVFSIERVRGSKTGAQRHREYADRELGGRNRNERISAPHALYSVDQQPSTVNGGLLTTISFDADNLEHETISIDLTCTNGSLPYQLAVGDICEPGQRVPGQLTLKNISPISAANAPALEGERLWMLISNMSLNYLSLENVGGLKEILRAYDLPAAHDHQAQLASDELFAALTKVSHQNIDYLKRGVPVRGTRTLLEINPDSAECEAQWFLFGSVLQHFFALYASTHSFNQLQIISRSGAAWTWAANCGQQKTL